MNSLGFLNATHVLIGFTYAVHARHLELDKQDFSTFVGKTLISI